MRGSTTLLAAVFLVACSGATNGAVAEVPGGVAPSALPAARAAAVPTDQHEQGAPASRRSETTDVPNLWTVVDASVVKNDGPKSVLAMHERLTKLTPDQVLEIHREFTRQLARSYSWELWGAAYVING